MELSEEEKRLDVMMEVERRKALETMEQVEELRKEERIRCYTIFIHISYQNHHSEPDGPMDRTLLNIDKMFLNPVECSRLMTRSNND